MHNGHILHYELDTFSYHYIHVHTIDTCHFVYLSVEIDGDEMMQHHLVDDVMYHDGILYHDHYYGVPTTQFSQECARRKVVVKHSIKSKILWRPRSRFHPRDLPRPLDT